MSQKCLRATATSKKHAEIVSSVYLLKERGEHPITETQKKQLFCRKLISEPGRSQQAAEVGGTEGAKAHLTSDS